MRTILVCLTILSFLPLSAAGELPVLRALRPSSAAASLLKNGGFEERSGDAISGWTPWRAGFAALKGEGRGGGVAIICERRAGSEELGIGQTLALNRKEIRPLVISGWSRAENVDGAPDSGYSLYADIVYEDGSPLWGQAEPFSCGSHGWERRELAILPAKPVRSMTLYCLLRGHTGKVWFDDVSVEEVQAEGGAVIFQGIPVTVERVLPARDPTGEKRVLASGDGLAWTVQDGRTLSLRVDGRELAGEGASGFMARDVSAASDFHAFRESRCRPLDLELEVEYAARPTHIEVSGHVVDTRGEDRAVTLVFALPLDLEGWTWGDDIRRGRRIAASGEYIQATGVRCGATGTMSLYPLAPVFDETSGLALAIDMDRPAVYRLSYHAGTGQLAVAFDVALVAETRRFPRRAPLRFIIYRFDPRWGFRAAFEKLQEIYPSYFEVRSRRQGIWMPFTDVSTVQGWRDFGFRYHEGTNNVPFDDDSDILSFHYTEPMTWWMRMQSSSPRTPDAARSQRDKLAAGGEGQPSRMARVAQTCGMEDEAGEPCLLFRDTPWCDGAVWSINPNPHLPGESNGATVHWSEEIRNRRYGPQAKGALDGEYLDSLEGYVTAELNLRREHFIHSTVPLTFSRVSHRPALFKGLAIHEFTRWISADVHAMGKLLFANGVPYRFPFLCPWLDVMGTETNWLRGGRLAPPSDAQLCLWRTMAGAKPYLLLMNTDYNALGPELVEEYFLISLFHGFYPSMFSHNASEDPYWKNPRWYDRDRHLFVKYQPLIRRVAEAGWRPVTHARCTDPDILVERFGPDEKGCSFFTLRNPTGETRGGRLVIDPRALSISAEQRVESLEARELIRGLELEDEAWRVAVRLGPGEVWAIQACPRR